MAPPSTPLSAVIPPLICGTGTFNTQYNPDPFKLPTTTIVHRALSLGVKAFDTSPYYGPSEELLGLALDEPLDGVKFPRQDYQIITKVGRIGASHFDYSASWVRQSIKRSLERLKTTYLDLVYCHDVEFVSVDEAIEAITELRRIRDEEGRIRYVGISGYPVAVLCDVAEIVLERTGEPLDAVQSYANYTLQNTQLASVGLSRLVAAGVSVVPNASLLGMGLLRRNGIPVGGQGDWHPAPEGLRVAVHEASMWCDAQGEKIEQLAIQFAMDTWLETGSVAGTSVPPAISRHEGTSEASTENPSRFGVSVMGVSNIGELEETIRLWNKTTGNAEERRNRRSKVLEQTVEVRKILGKWTDFAWPSPEPGFVNQSATPG